DCLDLRFSAGAFQPPVAAGDAGLQAPVDRGFGPCYQGIIASLPVPPTLKARNSAKSTGMAERLHGRGTRPGGTLRSVSARQLTWPDPLSIALLFLPFRQIRVPGAATRVDIGGLGARMTNLAGLPGVGT